MKVVRAALILGFAITALGLPRMSQADPPPEQVESVPPPEAGAEESPEASPAETPESPAVAPGTVITKANWMQYKQFFSDGEIGLWEGKWFWKMPDDAQINVGPTKVYPLPAPFVELTEKYGDQTQLVKQPDGRWQVKNYVAGMPFAIPSEPNMGLKILANVYYRIQPHLTAGFSDSGTPASICNTDRFNDVFCWKINYDFRQMAYNWEPNVQRVEKDAGGAWLGEWVQLEEPEQYRYIADLVLEWQDNLRLEDNYVFIPALRRSLRLSDASHCSPIFHFGDLAHDDIRRIGSNGGISDFDASFIEERKLLALTQLTDDDGKFPDSYDMPLAWAKPSWGAWELRDVWVIDIRPIALIAPRYCYAKRVMYADVSINVPLAEDLYDTKMNLSKVVIVGVKPAAVPGYGMQTWAGGAIQQLWDLKNEHAVMVFTADERGRKVTIDSAVKPQYDNIHEFQSSGVSCSSCDKFTSGPPCAGRYESGQSRRGTPYDPGWPSGKSCPQSTEGQAFELPPPPPARRRHVRVSYSHWPEKSEPKDCLDSAPEKA
jgi:hypothetical protein